MVFRTGEGARILRVSEAASSVCARQAIKLYELGAVTTCLARGDCFLGLGRTVLGSATYRF